MSYLPEEELRAREGLNLAPMIDFLFLMLMFFASLAVSRATTKDTDIDLVEAKSGAEKVESKRQTDYKVITINIGSEGDYKWVTDIRDYAMAEPGDIQKELLSQYQKGLLNQDKLKTQVMLRIDKNAKWDPILKAILAIREAGFEVRPVYTEET